MPLVELSTVLLVIFLQVLGLSAAPVPYSSYIARSSGVTISPSTEVDVRVIERSNEDLGFVRQTNDETKCNGHVELCDRKYGNTSFLASHDSFADSPHWYALSRTQEVGLEAQMALGVRALQAQSRMVNGVLHFCHTSCILFDGGTVEAYLLKVKKFLDENPYEVMTFIFTNPEHHSIADEFKPIFEKTGMDKLSYIPPQPVMTREDWPTLREMIDSGKRLVVFVDKGADERREPEKEYILPEFKMVWEDPYNPTDAAFPCRVDRTKGPLLPTQQLYLVNHNLNINLLPIGKGFKLPDRLNSQRTNGVQSILHQAYQCAVDVMEGNNPNFVLLDFVDIGFGMRAVDQLNGFLPQA